MAIYRIIPLNKVFSGRGLRQVNYKIVTRLSAREKFVDFCRLENFKLEDHSALRNFTGTGHEGI